MAYLAYIVDVCEGEGGERRRVVGHGSNRRRRFCGKCRRVENEKHGPLPVLSARTNETGTTADASKEGEK